MGGVGGRECIQLWRFLYVLFPFMHLLCMFLHTNKGLELRRNEGSDNESIMIRLMYNFRLCSS